MWRIQRMHIVANDPMALTPCAPGYMWGHVTFYEDAYHLTHQMDACIGLSATTRCNWLEDIKGALLDTGGDGTYDWDAECGG